ncbi:ABC transporter permease [Azospirillum doebereinerae]
MLRTAAAIILLGGWEVAGRSGLVLSEVVPPASAVLRAAGLLLIRPAFYAHLLTTVVEIAAAVGFALLGAVIVAALCGASRFLRDGLAPVLYYLAPTPKIIFFPVALGALGVGPGSKIMIGALSAFFPIAIGILSGLMRIEPIYLDVGRSFKLNAWQTAIRIYVPCLWGAMLTGLRLGVGLGIIGVLLAETKLASHGLGFLAIQSYNAFRIVDLYAVILLAFAVAALINALISLAERRQRHA